MDPDRTEEIQRSIEAVLADLEDRKRVLFTLLRDFARAEPVVRTSSLRQAQALGARTPLQASGEAPPG